MENGATLFVKIFWSELHLTQSQLFFKIDQNLICLGTAHKCWDFVAIWRGVPRPNQKFTKNDIKITNHQKWDFFRKKIICLEYPKTQNQHYFFFLFGNPNVGEGDGCQAGWDKIPTFTKYMFLWLP